MERFPNEPEANPYAAPHLPLERPRRPAPSGRGLLIPILSSLQTLTLVVGIGWMFFNIETIMGSGPIYCVFGLLVIIAAFFQWSPMAILFGGQAIGYSLFIFLLIYLLDWGPAEADLPVKIMTIAYTLAIGLPFYSLLLIRILKRSSAKQQQPNQPAKPS